MWCNMVARYGRVNPRRNTLYEQSNKSSCITIRLAVGAVFPLRLDSVKQTCHFKKYIAHRKSLYGAIP